MVTTASMQRDANYRTIETNEAFVTPLEVALTGAAGAGAVGTVNLFTVTGTVVVSIFAVCSEDLAGATATLEVGIAGNTAGLLAQTLATDIDNGEVWVDNTPATIEAVPSSRVLTNGTDIIGTVGTANITDGTLTFYCLWRPLSNDGNIVAV